MGNTFEEIKDRYRNNTLVSHEDILWLINEIEQLRGIDIYSKPEPSLCDTCTRTYFLEGGACGINDKTYKQRYCPHPLPGQPKTGRSIHSSGYQECDGYNRKQKVI